MRFQSALRRARTCRGPLRPAVRKAIVAYVLDPNPTVEAWHEICYFIIDGKKLHLHLAVAALDPSLKREPTIDGPSRWSHAPDGFTVARALVTALYRD